MSMEIIIVGLSHKTAPVEIREKISFPEHKLADALARLCSRPGIEEGVILSTCNRVEILACAAQRRLGAEQIKEFISCYHELPRDDFEPHLYIHGGEQAIRHIFRVACSLDSMVVGEPQILGQLKAAYQKALESRSTGAILNNLFNKAFSVGKKVRSETGIAKNAVSVSFAAVELARKIFGDLNAKVVLVIGTGEMSELVAQHLVSNGVKQVLVANRTHSRAQEFAAKFAGQAVPYDDLARELARADIVISSTGAPHFILRHEQVARVIQQRKYKPMFFIDIAVPRDIDPKVNEIDNAYLYDIDDLQSVVQANIEERRKEARVAEQMIAGDVSRFAAWLSALEVVPVVVALRRKMEEIRRRELQKTLKRLGGLSEKERQAVEALSSGIVNKILHQPTVALKGEADSQELRNYLDVVCRLFDLQIEGEKDNAH